VQIKEYQPAPETVTQKPYAVAGATAATPPSPPAPTNPPPTPTPAGPTGPVPAPHDRIARIVLPVVALAVGVLGMIDLAGADVAASAYVALPLTIVGLGLIVRAWYGRGWSLAVFGAILALALVIVTAAERADEVATTASTWRPLTVDQVDATYAANVGDAVLDMSGVDFSGQNKEVQVNLGAGNLTIVVSSRVDVQADIQVNLGNAVVFGEQWGGIGQSRHTVTDLGSDGTGGGELVLRATVNVGNVEVHR
jgi:Cell wall-active antibiotics response 4TMS YvqF